MKVGRETGHELHQSVVDDRIGVEVPAGQRALLRRSQEELKKKEKTPT